MNVIGIVQTDLNEFTVLFEQEQQNRHHQHNNQDQQNNQDGSSFFTILDDDSSQGSQQQGNNNQSQNEPQEMTVRIKGIPEGEKATFLQMYQIIQDAKEINELRSKLTIVDHGEDQGLQGFSFGGQQGQNEK